MKKIHRRQFLGAAAGGTLAATDLLRGAENPQKLKIGLIGCGWYGMVDLKAALKVGGVEFVALCDVDREHLDQNAEETKKLQGTRPKTFKDYRELLEVPGLQALIIATPPQWHALPFIAACRKGLDIYCEKPVAYDIREGRAMVDAARRAGNIVQIGFQRRQSAAIRQAAEYIRGGKAGDIIQVDVHIHYKAGMRDTTPQEPPESLDWDTWCGPAPKLPYSPNIGHFAWRLEAAYGNGHLVDWGIHLVDAVRNVLGETTPRGIQAAGGIYYYKDKITTPDILTVHFDFDRCPVVWSHRIYGAAEYSPEVANGIFFYGEKETVFATDREWIIVPKGKGKKQQVLEPKMDRSMGVEHMADFLDAVRSRKQPSCPPEDGYRSTATVQLGMIAYHAGAKILWDAKTERITNNTAANSRLKREYRAPWKHPYTG